MNRNVESHFSLNPTNIDIQRSTFDRSHSVKFSFNVGDLIPFYVDEVLPGDTFNVTTSKVVRMQPLVSAPMDNLFLDTYYFFVPNRLDTVNHLFIVLGNINTAIAVLLLGALTKHTL